MDVLERIESSLETLRPALRGDGGDVELVGFDDREGVATVRLVGVCGACPISPVTVKQGIEKRVRSMVPEVREVKAVEVV
ncbi:MAG: NifU family protein [Longimicrobiaceae bacterium]